MQGPSKGNAPETCGSTCWTITKYWPQQQTCILQFPLSWYQVVILQMCIETQRIKSLEKGGTEIQDGGVGRHTAPPRTTRTDRESNGKEVRHQGNKI